MELGTGESFFDDEYGIWSQLVTDCWLKHVRQFQEEHGISIDHDVPKLHKQTQSDAFLMRMFGAQGYKGNGLMLLNQCCCFCTLLRQSIWRWQTVAEYVMTNNGRASETTLEGQPTNSGQDRNDLRKELETLKGGTLESAGTINCLETTMGFRAVELWSCYYDPISKELFHQEGAVWIVWRPNGWKGLRNTSRTFSKGHLGTYLPQGVKPGTVSRLSITIQTQIMGEVTFQEPAEKQAMLTLDQWLLSFRKESPREAWRNLDEIGLVDDPTDMVHSIQTGNVCAISDCSFKDRQGSERQASALSAAPVIQMFPQLGSLLIAVTPVIGIVHSERNCTPVSCSAVHSCAA
jgi:hypothetical protein